MVQKKLSKPKTISKPGKPLKPQEVTYPANYWLALFCAVIAFFLYMNTMGHGYVLDDSAAITNNRFVQEGLSGIPKLLTIDFWHFTGLKLGYYRPLPLITFAIENAFFKLNPHVSHIDNVLLFALTTFFVFLIISKIFPSKNPIFPLFVTLLFASFPVHTEVVANIKSRDELLCFFNIVMMIYSALQYLERKNKSYLFFSFFFFYLALLSKESAVTGIFLIPLCLYYRGYTKISELVEKSLPYIAAIIIFYLQKNILLETFTTNLPNDIVNYPYNAPEVKYSSLFMLFLFFFRILFYPDPLRYDYSYNYLPAIKWDSPLAWFGLLAFGLLIWLGIKQVQKKSSLGFAIGFFFITLIPALAFVFLRGGIFAERFLFAPSLGFSIAIVWILEMVTHTSFSKKIRINFDSIKSVMIIFPLVLIIAGLYSYQTVSRNKAWKDEFTLYSTDIKTGATSAQNQLHMAAYYLSQAYTEADKQKKTNEIIEGQEDLKQALAVHPTFGDAFFWMGVVYNLRATIQGIQNLDTAIYYYNQAIIYSPSFYVVYINLGDIYKWLHRYDVASYYFNEAIRWNPEDLTAQAKAKEIRDATGLDVHSNPLFKQGDSNEQTTTPIRF
jgi:tetratricopeptide (TPR) repeat protein